MNTFKNKILIASVFMVPSLGASALDASHYAPTSRLASGKWAKVKVTTAGMNLITDTQLKNLGFTDPSKVRVYGLGGRELDYGLNADTPDDLPLIPSVRTSKGIAFFAVDKVTWTTTPTLSLPYTHGRSQYSDDTWYFVSDIESSDEELPATTAASKAAESRTTFVERALHEQDLEMAGELGAQAWGEDFRSKKSQTFSFTFADMADDAATVNVRFGAKTVSGTSSIILSANGERLGATNSDKISASTNASIGRVTSTSKLVTGLDGSLELGIEFSYSGVLYTARLDYIEAFYNRHLNLNKSELHFYVNLNAGEGCTLSGCSASTVIWDVTDPVFPRKVEYLLEGDKAHFTSTVSGNREYVAFEPESVSRAVTPAGAVANQDIHGLDTPHMVIISPSEYTAGAEEIARVHRVNDGMTVHVLTPEQIYNEFSGGKPDAGAFRRLLKMWHDRGTADGDPILRYALLMGKPLNDNRCLGAESKNAGYKPMLMWQSFDGLEESESFSNDAWLGMVDDVEHSRFSMKNAKIHVAVGRIPCKTSAEALVAAKKVANYVENPDLGPWRNKVMIIADDEDNGVHLSQAQDVYNMMRSAGNGSAHLYDRLYLDSYERTMTAIGATYPQATERMLSNYNDGVAFTNYIGHASATGWGHEHLWEWQSIQSMNNKRLTFIYGATCSFAQWDGTSVSGAETLLLNPDGGIIGMIAASRTVYITLNGQLNRETMRDIFSAGEDGAPLRWGDVFMRGQNRINDTNSLRYALIGDPAVRMPGGSSSVSVTSIDGKEISSSPNEWPELQASSTVTIQGEILGADGTLDAGFNGNVNLQLYDSERVITTFGNGAQGEIVSYNDRDKRLSTATAPVKDGVWKATLRIPPEIQGNYTPGLISCYAWSDKGEEANGYTENFYVYGYNEENPDTNGPEIEEFYVNSPNLTANQVISSNMLVFARLRDKSGINVSQSGIGHSLTLCLDGKDYIDGVASYYEQDAEDPDLGTITFPLCDVQPGRHTLTLTAWDNANNVSTADLEINVGAAVDPVILDITASTNTATASVDFVITLDRPNSDMKCELGVYDLSGRKLWEDNSNMTSDVNSVISSTWNLCDKGGKRVPRGIYIYRARVETEQGLYSTKSKKIAVTALPEAQR